MDTKSTRPSLRNWKLWQLIDLLSTIFHKISALLLLLIIIATWYQIFARVANVSVSGITEAGGYLLIWISYFAIASNLKKGSHIRVDVFLRKMPERVQTILSIISNMMCVIFSGIMVFESIKLVNMYYAINEISLFLGIHLYIVYMALPVGLLLFGLEALKEIVFTLSLFRTNHGQYQEGKTY